MASLTPLSAQNISVPGPRKFYGLPKVHKQNTPLRPIVSSMGTITYNCAKLLADILSPLVGNSVHHVANSKDFILCTMAFTTDRFTARLWDRRSLQ